MMLGNNPYLLQKAHAQIQPRRRDCDFWATCTALKLFQRARRRSWWGRLWAALRGRSSGLLDLDAVERDHTIRGRHHAGTRQVPLAKVRGSEGRGQDFDAEFRPLRLGIRDRWVSVAVARLMGVTLSPVKLVQVGDDYYVRDGHHRISVARALGEEYVDADLIVWDVVQPVLQEQAVIAGGMVGQAA